MAQLLVTRAICISYNVDMGYTALRSVETSSVYITRRLKKLPEETTTKDHYKRPLQKTTQKTHRKIYLRPSDYGCISGRLLLLIRQSIRGPAFHTIYSLTLALHHFHFPTPPTTPRTNSIGLLDAWVDLITLAVHTNG